MIQSHRSIAITSAERIRKYWRAHENIYEKPEVRVTPMSFEIQSNMINGYPPRRK